MSQGFLEQEAKRAKKLRRNATFFLLFMFIGIIVICYVYKSSLDMSDEKNSRLFGYLVFFACAEGIGLLFGIFNWIRVLVRGNDLVIPFKEDNRANVAKVINQEVAEGALVDEYIDVIPEGKKKRGERVLLTHSYLLLCNGMGIVTAIPRNKIYWLCPQVGHKGQSPYVIRFLVFTEKRTYYLDGVHIEHVEEITDKIYQYMPNIFEGHDPFILSYELEKIYDKNRNKFLEIYEYQKEEYAKNKEA